MQELINEIKAISKDITVLYVEDNAGLRENMSKLLCRIFDNVLFACDGKDGYENFLANRSQIIITDVNMPKLNGFKMIKKIKEIDPDVKIIILSAHDAKEHLHIAINLGVFRYLHKPAKLPELIEGLHESVTFIKEEENRRVFLNQMQNIFNYQNNLVVMMHEGKFTLSNQRFLEFFGVDNLKNFSTLNDMFLEHDEFLFSTPTISWQEKLIMNPEKLFHVKVKNYKDEIRHLILKSREVPEKDGYCVLSFDDVTELNLMALYDNKTAMSDATLKDKKSIISLIKVVKENSSEVKIHNFYKGLTIVTPAVIAEFTEEDVTFKTANSQLKIVQLTKFMIISSEMFPKSIVCKSIKDVDVDDQSITVSDMTFAHRTSADRQYIRLEPDKNHKCTLFYNNILFTDKVNIVDISEVSVKVKVKTLPTDIEIDTYIKVSMNVTLRSKQIYIITTAKVYRIDEIKDGYHIVALFNLDEKYLDKMHSYLKERQVALISEFKKLKMH